MRLRLTVSNDARTRATTDGTTPGTNFEQQVNTIDVFMGSTTSLPFTKQNSAPVTNPNTNQFWKLTDEGNAYLTSVWKQNAASTVNMAVMVNGRDWGAKTQEKPFLGVVSNGFSFPYNEDIIIGTRGTVTANYARAVKYNINGLGSRLLIEQSNSYGNQLMTSSITPVTLQPNVTENDAWYQKQNNVSLEVERVVVKGIVYKTTDNDYTVTNAAGTLGTIKNSTLKFTALNGATITYLFRNHAADGAFTSAIHNVTPGNTAEEAKAQNLVRLGNTYFVESGLDPMGGYKSQPIANLNGRTDAEIAQTAGIYFLENSAADYSDVTTVYGYNRYAYAKVYGQFSPATIYEWNGMAVVESSYTAGTTFYYGRQAARFYKTLDAALKDGNPRDRIFTYTNGWMAYRALWNRVETNGRVTDANVRRNHIYMLRIDAFYGLGMPWDPADPADTYLPKPADPEEPASNGPGMNPDIHNSTSNFMRVTSTVKPYEVGERDADLGLGY